MWTTCKAFIELITMLLLSRVLIGFEACGVLAPQPGIEPTPCPEGKLSHWTRKVPTVGFKLLFK